jgi:hypothetical protein
VPPLSASPGGVLEKGGALMHSKRDDFIENEEVETEGL